MPSSTLRQLVAPGHRDEALAVERVEADVDPAQPGGRSLAASSRSVAPFVVIATSIGPASVRSAASLATSTAQVGAHGRLAAGEADALDAVALDHQPGEALELLERQHLRPRQPRHLLVHAVRAAEVAAVGDRDAQVADDPPEAVDEVDVRHHARLGARRGVAFGGPPGARLVP